MRWVRPAAVIGLRRTAPFTWAATADESAFTFDVSAEAPPFFCFFVKAVAGETSPQVSFDRGSGFEQVSAITFRSFPFGFYHFPLSAASGAQRLRLRICEGRAAFRCVSFETSQPLLVAVLHFLFNLRYQNIGLIASAPGGERGRFALLKSNVARIRTFFSTVSAGGGLRVQQNEDDVLVRACLAQTLDSEPNVARMRDRLADRSERPLLSFVAPVFETPPAYLHDLVTSFTAQAAPYAELVLADDGSASAATKTALAELGATPGVRVLTLPRNGGIAVATNAGIGVARGEWISFIDHDDAFMDGAVAAIADAILAFPQADFFYTDEVITNATLKPVGSFCKPAFDSVLLSGMNYINHFSVFRRARLEALGGLRLDREGSQDYDLLLRYLAGIRPGAAIHIPYLAYRWRRGEESYSSVFRERSVANARLALRHAHAATHVSVEPAGNGDLHRLRFPHAARPHVTVVIPNRESLDLLVRVVGDLRERTRYPALDIVVVDNGSTDPDVLSFYETKRGGDFAAEIVPEPFNFARMCNRGARMARGDAILFLNNDIEVVEPDWLAEMVECLAFPDVGIVGAKLLYPDRSIQHAGVIVGLGEAAGHWYVNDPEDEPGPMGRLAVRQTLGAVTGACMLVTRSCFDILCGFDEAAFPIAYNDIDLCIRARLAGIRTVWTPFATVLHHESASRGSDETGENNIRFRTEFARLQERHGTKTLIDDAYSPFYDRRYSRPHLIVPTVTARPRANAFA